MGKMSEKTLGKRLTKIERGSYWFGIVGRLSLIFGFLYLITGGPLAVLNILQPGSAGPHEELIMGSLATGVLALVYGYLFLLGRDAFEAIAHLIKEMEGVV